MGIADGQEEVLVVGQEVGREWAGQAVEDTDWREGAKDRCELMGEAVLRRVWLRSVDRDQDYDRGRDSWRCWKKGSPGCPLLSFCHTFILYNLNLFNKNDLL